MCVHITSVEKTPYDTAKFCVFCTHESCSNYETKIYGRKKGKQIVLVTTAKAAAAAHIRTHTHTINSTKHSNNRKTHLTELKHIM